MPITQRQEKLLFSIIKEFIDTAEAVGSISLQNKYKFGLSPATIRNEMSYLVSEGFLFQKHSSAGRLPTTKGWRFFIDKVLERDLKELPQNIKEEIKTNLLKILHDTRMLFKESIHQLSILANNAAIAILEGEVYYSGLSYFVDFPEFRETLKLKKILNLLEDYNTLSEIMNKGNPENDLNILIGEETSLDEFIDCTVIFSEVRLNGEKKGYIAVLGPNRMQYDQVIPSVKYLVDTVRELLKKN